MLRGLGLAFHAVMQHTVCLSRASGGTADALSSGGSVLMGVGVQIPPRARMGCSECRGILSRRSPVRVFWPGTSSFVEPTPGRQGAVVRNVGRPLPSGRNPDAVIALPGELGIAPSIVLGRAQRVTKDYAWGHAMKRKFEWAPRASQI